jgi:pseudouridine kinase
MTRTAPSSRPITGRPAVVVIGGANLDFKCQTLARPIAGTSNPGRSRTAAGGVGRNVAENLVRLGVATALLTAIGADADGVRLTAETEAAGVDLRYVLATNAATGTYTAIIDDTGEMIIAVSSMDGMAELTAAVIDARRDVISQARILVLDCNVPGAALSRAAAIATESGIPVVVDPVSVTKASRLGALLGERLRVHTVTPNLDELQALTQTTGSTDGDLRESAARLHGYGVQNVWVRLGPSGSFLSSMQGGVQSSEYLPAAPATLVDATGAGDAMLAGYVAGLLHGLDAFSAARYGRAAAAITVESEHTVNPSINFESLAARVAAHSNG